MVSALDSQGSPWIKILGIFDIDDYPNFNLLTGLNIINFFVEYCCFDIPIGFEFIKILNTEGEIIYENTMILKDVNQQFNIKTESIPLGWKTICSIEFIYGNIPKEILDFSVIKTWHESKGHYFLN